MKRNLVRIKYDATTWHVGEIAEEVSRFTAKDGREFVEVDFDGTGRNIHLYHAWEVETPRIVCQLCGKKVVVGKMCC